jgi:nucleoside-diphosphate-sugar epimerase
MVFLSSASVYGAAELTGGLLDEAASAPAPRSVYAVSKFAAERLAERLAPQDAISLRLLRLGSVFGPWEHATGVRATLSPIFQTTGIAVSGSGSCVLPREGRRDWIYSRDVAAAVLRAVIADEATPGPVNIGLGHEWTVADWCDRLARRFAGFSYRLSAGGEVATIDFHGAADRAALAIDRLHGSLAFQPNYGLEAAFDDYTGWIGAHPQFLEGCGDGRL